MMASTRLPCPGELCSFMAIATTFYRQRRRKNLTRRKSLFAVGKPWCGLPNRRQIYRADYRLACRPVFPLNFPQSFTDGMPFTRPQKSCQEKNENIKDNFLGAFRGKSASPSRGPPTGGQDGRPPEKWLPFVLTPSPQRPRRVPRPPAGTKISFNATMIRPLNAAYAKSITREPACRKFRVARNGFGKSKSKRSGADVPVLRRTFT